MVVCTRYIAIQTHFSPHNPPAKIPETSSVHNTHPKLLTGPRSPFPSLSIAIVQINGVMPLRLQDMRESWFPKRNKSCANTASSGLHRERPKTGWSNASILWNHSREIIQQNSYFTRFFQKATTILMKCCCIPFTKQSWWFSFARSRMTLFLFAPSEQRYSQICIWVSHHGIKSPIPRASSSQISRFSQTTFMHCAPRIHYEHPKAIRLSQPS